MYKECEWLPELIKIPYEIESEESKNYLYSFYLKDLKQSTIIYQGKEVKFRKHPECEGKEEAFFHIIAGLNYPRDRIVTERAQRLLWGKAIIENTPCKCVCCNEKVQVWQQPQTNPKQCRRYKLYMDKRRYVVVLEERADFWLYITSFYVNNSQERRKFLKEYHDFSQTQRLNDLRKTKSALPC